LIDSNLTAACGIRTVLANYPATFLRRRLIPVISCWVTFIRRRRWT